MVEKKRKRATAETVAKAAGVSRTTVSFVFNNRGGVSEGVAKKVRKTAKELGYKPNRSASAIRTGKSHTIGLILPDLTNPYFPKLAQGAQLAASEAGYVLFLVDSFNDLTLEAQGVESINGYAVDGILWCPVEERSLQNNPVTCPIVVIDRQIDGYDCVYADDIKGGKLQAEYVSQKGHQKIGLVTGPSRTKSAVHRRKSFVDNLPKSSAVIWEHEIEYDINIPKGVIPDLAKNNVTCIVCGNDTIAVGVISALRRLEIKVPENVSVMGYDDIDWCTVMSPSLTSINLPAKEIGRKAIKRLIERIEGKSEAVRSTILDVELVERETVIEVV